MDDNFTSTVDGAMGFQRMQVWEEELYTDEDYDSEEEELDEDEDYDDDDNCNCSDPGCPCRGNKNWSRL